MSFFNLSRSKEDNGENKAMAQSNEATRARQLDRVCGGRSLADLASVGEENCDRGAVVAVDLFDGECEVLGPSLSNHWNERLDAEQRCRRRTRLCD